MRLFLAIPLPPEARDALAGAVVALRRTDPAILEPQAFKWVRPDNYHVTVKFLGEADERRLPDVRAACRPAVDRSRAAMLTLHSLALHPPARAARLIVARLDGDNAAVASLADALEADLHAIGFPREGRPFWPHVTVARSRMPVRLEPPQRARWADWVAAQGTIGAAVPVNAIELIESQLRPSGPIYTTLETLRLPT